MGAIERRAIDELVNRYGADVKISYETQATRLHAKAWLFRRNTGFDTAYVGNSNLSQAALLDGLGWNVRLSSVATPALLQKFEVTFDSYWEQRVFQSYDPERDGEKLEAALETTPGWPRRHGLCNRAEEVLSERRRPTKDGRNAGGLPSRDIRAVNYATRQHNLPYCG